MFAVTLPSKSDLWISGGGQAARSARTRMPILQKSFGVAELTFSHRDGITKPKRVFQQGSLKVRFPTGELGESPEAVLINLAGGLTGGDHLEFCLSLEDSARALVTTQACERIYRSTGEDAAITTRMVLQPGAYLNWLPQATIFFDAARLKRETYIELAADATLLAVESIIFGRTASGESVVSGSLSDTWFVHREGRLIHAECFAVADAIQEALDRASVLDGNRAMATIRYLAPDAEGRLEEMRGLLSLAPVENAAVSVASAWNGMMIVRIVAPDGYRLVREVGRVLSGFCRKLLPRVWLL